MMKIQEYVEVPRVSREKVLTLKLEVLAEYFRCVSEIKESQEKFEQQMLQKLHAIYGHDGAKERPEPAKENVSTEAPRFMTPVSPPSIQEQLKKKEEDMRNKDHLSATSTAPSQPAKNLMPTLFPDKSNEYKIEKKTSPGGEDENGPMDNQQDRVKQVFTSGSEKLKKALSGLKSSSMISPLRTDIVCENNDEQHASMQPSQTASTQPTLMSPENLEPSHLQSQQQQQASVINVKPSPVEAEPPAVMLPTTRAGQLMLDDDLLDAFSPIVPVRTIKAPKKEPLRIPSKPAPTNTAFEIKTTSKIDEKPQSLHVDAVLPSQMDLMDEKPMAVADALLKGDSFILEKSAALMQTESKALKRGPVLPEPKAAIPTTPKMNKQSVAGAPKPVTPSKLPVFIASGNKTSHQHVLPGASLKLKALVPSKAAASPLKRPVTQETPAAKILQPLKRLPIPGQTANRRIQQLKHEDPASPSPMQDISLPAINTEDEYGSSFDEDADEEELLQKRLKLERRPDWVLTPELKRSLESQQAMNPDVIFCSLATSISSNVKIEEIFENVARDSPSKGGIKKLPKATAKTNTNKNNASALSSKRTSSANWAGSDRLTSKEIQKYNADMGYN